MTLRYTFLIHISLKFDSFEKIQNISKKIYFNFKNFDFIVTTTFCRIPWCCFGPLANSFVGAQCIIRVRRLALHSQCVTRVQKKKERQRFLQAIFLHKKDSNNLSLPWPTFACRSTNFLPHQVYSLLLLPKMLEKHVIDYDNKYIVLMCCILLIYSENF